MSKKFLTLAIEAFLQGDETKAVEHLSKCLEEKALDMLNKKEATTEPVTEAMVSRDSFARSELHRTAVPDENSSCTNCGGHRKTKSGKKYLHEYSTQSDGGRKIKHKGLFCTKNCHDSYHS